MKLTLFFLVFLTTGLYSWAGLGQHEDSITTDQQQLKGRIRKSVATNYTVHQITQDNGTVVNEYVSPSGIIFGVSWHGPAVPDLAQLLADYFPKFQENLQTPRLRNRHSAIIRTDDLVVENAGYQRDHHGRAYVPSLIPQGVSEAVIQ